MVPRLSSWMKLIVVSSAVCLVGMRAAEGLAGDVNANGAVDVLDAVAIVDHVLGKDHSDGPGSRQCRLQRRHARNGCRQHWRSPSCYAATAHGARARRPHIADVADIGSP